MMMLNPAAVAAAAAAARHPVPGGPQQGQAQPPPFKLNIIESIERIKEEFNFLQAQYHNLKLECEKLVQEKTEMQRHYVMYYEMSYGLNVEMHKQMEIAKRLNAIIAQLLPFLSQEHQQQVVTAVERAKQVTMSELNSIIGQQQRPDLSRLMQLQAAGGVPGLPGLPHGFPGNGIPGFSQGLGGIPTSAASLLAGLPTTSSASASALMAAHMGIRLPGHHSLPTPHDFLKKEEEERERQNSSKPHIATPGPMSDERNRQSLSPSREKPRSPLDRRSPIGLPDPKKMKKEEHLAPVNGMRRTPPKENGLDHHSHKKDSASPHSTHSSASSTPAPTKKNGDDGKPPTPKSGGHRSPSSLDVGGPALKSGLPGPPYGLGFPPPPGLPTNTAPDAAYRPPYDAHPALRGPPALGLPGPPGGKPYGLFFPC
jgi:groucho